jgi:hypothetical protein
LDGLDAARLLYRQNLMGAETDTEGVSVFPTHQTCYSLTERGVLFIEATRPPAAKK